MLVDGHDDADGISTLLIALIYLGLCLTYD